MNSQEWAGWILLAILVVVALALIVVIGMLFPVAVRMVTG